MPVRAAIRYATPSCAELAPSDSIAQIPTYVQPAENDAVPTKETASSGRSGRSTSPPQIRRKRRATSLTQPRLSAEGRGFSLSVRPAPRAKLQPVPLRRATGNGTGLSLSLPAGWSGLDLSAGRARLNGVIREELGRLLRWEERHRRLVARIVVALSLTTVVDVVGVIAVWRLERHARGTEIHGLGDAFFFTTVQLLTISSQLKNPLTAAGRAVDVVLEAWAIVVVASLAGSFATFFSSADR